MGRWVNAATVGVILGVSAVMAYSTATAQIGGGEGQIIENAGEYDLSGSKLYGSRAADSDTYLQRSAADEMTLTCGGTAAWVCDASTCEMGSDIDLGTNGVQLVLDDGDVNDPAITFKNDDDGVTGPGMYRTGADSWRLTAANNDSRLEMGTSGSYVRYSTTYLAAVGGEIRMNSAYFRAIDGVTKLGNNPTVGHGGALGSVAIGEDAAGVGLEVDGTAHFDKLVTAYAGLKDQSGTTLPATCTQSTTFHDTDSDDCADTGGGDGAVCFCKTTNTWALLTDI